MSEHNPDSPLCRWCGRSKWSHVHPTQRCFDGSSEFYEPSTKGGDEQCAQTVYTDCTMTAAQKSSASNAPAIVPPDAPGAITVYQNPSGEWTAICSALECAGCGAIETDAHVCLQRAILSTAITLKAENERLKAEMEERSKISRDNAESLSEQEKENDALSLQLAKMREEILYAQTVLGNNGLTWHPQSLRVTSDQTEWVKKEELERMTCPACKGRGGFDSAEDSHECAWCKGSGETSFVAIQEEVSSLLKRSWTQEMSTREEIAAIRSQLATAEAERDALKQDADALQFLHEYDAGLHPISEEDEKALALTKEELLERLKHVATERRSDRETIENAWAALGYTESEADNLAKHGNTFGQATRQQGGL